MGHNIDLKWLLGLPEFVRCPGCKELTPTDFDEYDIDCGEPQVQSDKKMFLDIQCRHCEAEIKQEVEIKVGKLWEEKR